MTALVPLCLLLGVLLWVFYGPIAALAPFYLLLGVLLWMFYGPHQRLRLAETRHRLFVLRDRLFDAAALGEDIRFEDRAYAMARTTLNGMLRTLEDQGAVRWLVVLWQVEKYESELAKVSHHERDFHHALGELSSEGRGLVWGTLDEAARILFAHMVSTSLCLLALSMLERSVRLLRIRLPQWQLPRPLRPARRKAVLRQRFNSAGRGERGRGGYAHA